MSIRPRPGVTGAGDVAPPALHNSGPGPMAVYRTASVGQTFRLDLGAMLRCWIGLPAELRAPMAITLGSASSIPAS